MYAIRSYYGRGYGKAMARLFVERVFGDAEAGVNKVSYNFV